MTRLRKTNLDVFIPCQYTKTILRKKNMWESLFKTHSKFLNFGKIFYCGITRLRNRILNYCGLCRYMKAIKPKKVVRHSLFKNHWKNFYISIFNNVFYYDKTKGRHKLEEVFRKYIYRKATVRKKIIRQNSFIKCCRCHRLVKYFNASLNSPIFPEKPYPKLF